MGDLAKYIAEVIEFIVAGILVLFSLLLFPYVIVQPDLASLGNKLRFVESMGALVPLFGLALIYALGILAEGVSRALFEKGWISDKLFQGGLESRTVTAFSYVVSVESRRGAITQDLGKPPEGLGTDDYVKLREIWRMKVVARNAALAAQVDGQLKRLRVERAAALSGFIACLALVMNLVLDIFRQGGVENLTLTLLVVVAVITLCAVLLSVVRLKRFVDAIIRCHDALPQERPQS